MKPPKAPTKAQGVRLWHQLRDFERQTRQPGRQDGTITRNGLAVAHALIFDFLNWRTGQLDPAYATIAKKAAISVRSVARGLQALKAAGVLAWVRRCVEVMRDGRYSLEQESNLYHMQPATAWRGYKAPPVAPAPEAETWGAASVIPRGSVETGTFDRDYELIEAEGLARTGDKLAAVCARILRAELDREQGQKP